MARRPLRRVFGETSIELKCLILFGVFLLLVITASFLSYWIVTENVVGEQNPKSGGLLADQDMLIMHWRAFELKNEQFLSLVKSLTRDKPDKDYEVRYLLPDPTQPEKRQPRNDFERDLLQRYMSKKQTPPPYVERDDPQSDSYMFYRPIWGARGCVGGLCHLPESGSQGGFPTGINSPILGWGGPPGGPPLSEDDLMGVVCVTIPSGPLQARISWYWNALLAVAILTAFLAMIAFYVTIRYLIVRPLKHLRDVSDAISHGNIALRADIHTGDEFEALGLAFNRMLRHLVTAQDELRQVNADLDAKVDELAQVNMQLYEMNRVKSDFLATMSHELRTPLNSILGFSDVLGSIDSLDEKQKRYVTNIQKSGRMLLEMINNILDLAKIESGKMEIRLTEFSIEHVITAQCEMARPLTERKNIDLETEIQPDLPPLHQDQARVQQILNNLLSNAIKFTPEGGRIKVTARRSERGDLLLRVIDTGVGIAEEDQQSIFEKFRQGRTAMPGGDAMTREYSGTGLGLSIVKELCRLLEGEVSVESQLGTGSAFTVRLPWRLERKPRLESPLAVGLEEFAKPRIEVAGEAGVKDGGWGMRDEG
jgi:two-component system sensor histidine kinase BarA